MKILRITVVVFLFSFIFAPISHAAGKRELTLQGGEKLTINKVFVKEGAKMPPPDSVSIVAIQGIWNRLSNAAGFDAFIMYDPKEEVNAYITQVDKDSFLLVLQLGLLKVLKTEDEIAGVLGHEIGHGVKRHGEKRQGNAVGVMIGANILSSVLGGSVFGDLAVGIGANLAAKGYSRENEVEADDFGVEYSAKAGFSPWGLYDSIERMAKAGLITPPSGFNSHPPTERRMTRLKNEAEKWEKYMANSRTAGDTGRKSSNAAQAVKEINAPDKDSAINKSDKADVIASYPLTPGDKNLLTILHNRAMALYNSGKYKEALPVFIRGVDSYEGNYLA
ncbi:MAG: M48 family metalloprotease, partial [Synergistaceae bacterium]|nr:M48 family metalloprotease [Synergistaceae bacterium]